MRLGANVVFDAPKLCSLPLFKLAVKI